MSHAATTLAPASRDKTPESPETKPRTLLIMPAFNEGPRLRSLLEHVRSTFADADILVIDDGSSDATAAEASAGGAYVARHPFNLGYGAALQTGYRYAVDQGYDYLLQMDSDGQHDPLCLPDVLEPVRSGKTDVAIGSRYLAKGYRSPIARRVGSVLFGGLASVITGKRVSDPTSGFWAMNREALELCARDTFPYDYPDADVLIALHRAGLRMAEVPVRMFPRHDGFSMHGGLRPFYYVFKMSLSIFVELLRKRVTR